MIDHSPFSGQERPMVAPHACLIVMLHADVPCVIAHSNPADVSLQTNSSNIILDKRLLQKQLAITGVNFTQKELTICAESTPFFIK